MRSYGKKIIKRRINELVGYRSETRNAWLYSIDTTSKTCQVIIQGALELVTAHYPRNWEHTPQYMKPGNSVTLQHTGGNRGILEVIGHGAVIPAPVAGGVVPAAPGTTDQIISGCELLAPNPDYGLWMRVIVTTGTYQINGVTYTLAASAMGDASLIEMGMDTLLGQVAEVLEIAEATSFRYDLIVAGTDSVVHVVQGDEAWENPEFPQTPGSHLILGYVLVWQNMPYLFANAIGLLWAPPCPQSIRFDQGEKGRGHIHEMLWAHEFADLTFTILDQYGNAIAITSGKVYQLTLEFVSGNGWIGFKGSTDPVVKNTGLNSTVGITYWRLWDDEAHHPTLDNISPTLKIYGEIEGKHFETQIYIFLLDPNGNPMF